MRYITIPPSVKIFNPDTDEPVLDVKTGLQAEAGFAPAIRHLTNEMIKAKVMDYLEIVELRLALVGAKVGEEVGIEDTWWEAIVAAFKKTEGFTVMYITAARPHILAVNNATTEPR